MGGFVIAFIRSPVFGIFREQTVCKLLRPSEFLGKLKVKMQVVFESEILVFWCSGARLESAKTASTSSDNSNKTQQVNLCS